MSIMVSKGVVAIVLTKFTLLNVMSLEIRLCRHFVCIKISRFLPAFRYLITCLVCQQDLVYFQNSLGLLLCSLQY